MDEQYDYDVFISKESKNYMVSKKLYDFLTERKLKVFLSEISLPKYGNDKFKLSLDLGIAHSRNLVVICSKNDTLSKWVEDEWLNFIALRNTERRKTRIFTLRLEDSGINCIPKGLKHFESFTEHEFDRLYTYIINENIDDSLYYKLKSDEYVKMFLTGSFSHIKDSYFCLDAENYFELRNGLETQSLEAVSFKDDWNFHIESFVENTTYDKNELLEEEIDLWKESDNEEESEKSFIYPILDIIKNNLQLIILGNAGAGKTTTLKKIFLDSCYAYANNERDVVPIYIQLTKLNFKNDIITNIEESIGGCWITYFIKRNKVLILFDGLNEISSNVRDIAILNIKDFINKHPLCPMIFTSRVYNFINYFNFPLFKLLNLSSESIYKFIINKGGNKELYDGIKANKGFLDIASSPMMLTMLVEVWKKNKKIPKNKGQLYNEFINYNLQRETKKRIVNISPVHIKVILSCLAYYMKCENAIFLHRDSMYRKLRDILNDKGFPYNDSLLFDELLNGDFLIEDIKLDISFVHETFQEFFAALYLSNIYHRTKSWPINNSDNAWHDTFKMAIELVTPLLTSHEKICLIDNFTKYIRGDLGYNTDLNIAVVCHIFASMFDVIYEYKNYMEQYLLFIVVNWEQIYNNEDCHPDLNYIEGLYTAIAIVSSEPLFKIIIFSERWRNYWLLGINCYKIKFILNTYTSNKRLLYDWVDCAAEILQDTKIRNKMMKFSVSLLHFLSNEELSELYYECNNLLYLFSMSDANFIKSHLHLYSSSQIDDYSYLFKENEYNEEQFELVTTVIFPFISLKSKKNILESYIECRYNSDYVFNYVSDHISDKDIGSIIRRILLGFSDKLLHDRYKDLFRKIEICFSNDEYIVDNEYLIINDFRIQKLKFRFDSYNNAYISKSHDIFIYGIMNKIDYYHSFEIKENKCYLKMIGNLDIADIIKLIKRYDLYGYFPNQYLKTNKNSYILIVNKVTQRFVVAYKADGVLLLPAKLLDISSLQKGDLLLRAKKGKFFKVYNNDKSSVLGYKQGIVVLKRERSYCFIRVVGEDVDYFAPSTEWSKNFNIGDEVIFFPTINPKETYKNRKLALCCTLINK